MVVAVVAFAAAAVEMVVVAVVFAAAAVEMVMKALLFRLLELVSPCHHCWPQPMAQA